MPCRVMSCSHGGTANVFGMGYQSEIAWDNKCRANREVRTCVVLPD